MVLVNCEASGQIGGHSLDAFDAWLATSSVPQAERATFRQMYQNALSTVNAEQTRLIGVIVNCPRNTMTADQLRTMPIEGLRAMANLAAQPVPSYQPPVLNDYRGLMPSFGGQSTVRNTSLSLYGGDESDDAPLGSGALQFDPGDGSHVENTNGVALNAFGQPLDHMMPDDGVEPEPIPTQREMMLHNMKNRHAEFERGLDEIIDGPYDWRD